MTEKHFDRDHRLEQQYWRLGTRNPACIVCGESNPHCLELHHIAGQKHHADISIVCRNCHRKLTNQLQDHATAIQDVVSTSLVTIGRYLLGLCDLLAMVIQTLRDFGRWLVESCREQPS